MLYNVISHGTTETLVVELDDELRTVSGAHANFIRIREYLSGGGQDPQRVQDLLNVHAFVTAGLTHLSDRVAFTGGDITFDGDVIDTALSRHIVRMLREGNAFRPAVLFMERLAQNPSPLSRRHLWKWLDAKDFTLTPEGHIIGYKAVRSTTDNLSISAGRNLVEVNGTGHHGHVPNPIGAVVQMARAEVNPNRDDGCSTGLHVGTWDYARHFGGSESRVLTVAVNPSDVVSVPRDCGYEKMRVCRYTVLDVTNVPYDTALTTGYDDDSEYEDDDSAYF